MICEQGDAQGKAFSKEAVSCIPAYDAESRILVAELPEGAEGGSYLLTRAEYLEDGSLAITGYAFLDENRLWKSGTILKGKLRLPGKSWNI